MGSCDKDDSVHVDIHAELSHTWCSGRWHDICGPPLTKKEQVVFLRVNHYKGSAYIIQIKCSCNYQGWQWVFK